MDNSPNLPEFPAIRQLAIIIENLKDIRNNWLNNWSSCINLFDLAKYVDNWEMCMYPYTVVSYLAS